MLGVTVHKECLFGNLEWQRPGDEDIKANRERKCVWIGLIWIRIGFVVP
jgi:hypothetical protein